MSTFADREIQRTGLVVLACEKAEYPEQSMRSFLEMRPDADAELAVYGRLVGDGWRPVVGAPATWSPFTDRYACTVVRVSPSGKTVWTRDDRSVRVDDNGVSDCQHYRHERDEDGAVREWRLRRDGRWAGKSGRLVLGHRSAYHDFSF